MRTLGRDADGLSGLSDGCRAEDQRTSRMWCMRRSSYRQPLAVPVERIRDFPFEIQGRCNTTN
jgi:hypothetical protein